jgi:formamidopyrimidine-DNA glycosylase
MPELPEVETVVRWLSRSVLGPRLDRVEVLYPRLIRALAPKAFSRKMQGASFSSVGRRSKYILLHLNNHHTLLVHLRMTGQFFHVENSRPISKHASAIFHFDDGRKLVFEDTRRFGVMKLVPTSTLAETEELMPLAPEPLGPEFTVEYLRGILRKTSKTIKEALLDQTKVSGIGNIYASEALFAAGINPQVRANELSQPRVRKLHSAIVSVLTAAIEAGDKMNTDTKDSADTYFEGTYEGRFAVYAREGERCLRCGTIIKRIVQGARSTFYCPRCQKS